MPYIITMESVEFVGVHFHKNLTFLWDVIIWVVWVMLNLKYILARMEKVKKKKKYISLQEWKNSYRIHKLEGTHKIHWAPTNIDSTV